MSRKVKGEALYDDVITAPDDRIAEIVEGDLYLSPRPSLRHANAISVLTARLGDGFDDGREGRERWRILVEPELHLLGDVLVPDIAGWRWERFPELTDAVGAEIAPDWVCEVRSPSTKQFDRRQKLPRYAVAGVLHLWLIDPSNRRLEVFRRDGLNWILLESFFGEAIASAPPFESLPIELDRLWA